MKKLITGISLLAAGLLSLPASAALILQSHTFEGENDCSGYFGSGFGSCQIFADDNKDVLLSPVIAKYGFGDDAEEDEFNTDKFPSFDGNEISFDLNAQTWAYTPGENDPGIRYVAAKGSNAFNLFWYVDDATVGTACDGSSSFTFDCLNLALSVEEGSWTTPLNASGNQSGLSHLTFYDSDPPVLVPEPGTMGLIGLGLLGLALTRRRVAHQS